MVLSDTDCRVMGIPSVDSEATDSSGEDESTSKNDCNESSHMHGNQQSEQGTINIYNTLFLSWILLIYRL